jgi:hypothetical protein
VPLEGVASEVGEVEQQLASPVRVGAHERRDRVERVVDEVRRDLRPQRPDLRFHQSGPRGVELGQLELPGNPVCDLRRGPHQPGGTSPGPRLERADHPLLDGQRADHHAADQAVRVAAVQVTVVAHGGRAVGDPLAGQLGDVLGMRLGLAVPGEQALGVGQRDRGGGQQRAQVTHRLLRRGDREAGTQRAGHQ